MAEQRNTEGNDEGNAFDALLVAAELQRRDNERFLLEAENRRLRDEIERMHIRGPPLSTGTPFVSEPPTGSMYDSGAEQSNTEPLQLADALDRLADILHKKDKLPKREPAVYTGNIFDYPAWINSFKVLIEDQCPDYHDRLYYLGKYTSGDAKDAIKGMLAVSTEESYVRARRVLEERFGDKLRLARSFRDKINDLPEVKPGDSKALEKLSDFLIQCENAMGELSHLSVLNDPEEYEKIIVKLPKYLRERWFVEVDKYIYGPSDLQTNSVVGCSRRHDSFPLYFRAETSANREKPNGRTMCGIQTKVEPV